MAISEGTLQSLQVLREITSQGVVQKEAEKSRAANIAQTRIAADERRLERMSQRLERLNEVRMETANKYTELTGLQASIQKKQEKEGVRGSDALGFINGLKMNTIDEQDAVKSQMAETQSSIDMLNQRVAGYHEAYKVLAPREYEQYRASSGDKSIYDKSFVQGEEMNNLIATIEKKQGRALSQEQRSGLATRLEEMGKERFGMFLDEAKLNLGYANLRQTKLAAAKDQRSKQFVDQYKTWREGLKGSAITAELPTTFAAQLPDVMASIQDITKVTDKYLDEIGRLAAMGLDRGLLFGDTKKDLADAIDLYQEAFDRGDRPAARDAAASIARKLLPAGTVEDQLDFSNLPWKMDAAKQNYMRELVEGLPIFEQYADNVIMPDLGMSAALFQEREVRARGGKNVTVLERPSKPESEDKASILQWFQDQFLGEDPFKIPEKDKKWESPIKVNEKKVLELLKTFTSSDRTDFMKLGK